MDILAEVFRLSSIRTQTTVPAQWRMGPVKAMVFVLEIVAQRAMVARARM